MLSIISCPKMAHCAWYYDRTDDKKYSGDDDGNLAWLCDECAEQAGDDVEHASEDAVYDGSCWNCGGNR